MTTESTGVTVKDPKRFGVLGTLVIDEEVTAAVPIQEIIEALDQHLVEMEQSGKLARLRARDRGAFHISKFQTTSGSILDVHSGGGDDWGSGFSVYIFLVR